MFQHYLITRFNLRVADWSATKNNEDVLSETWLNHRFELFDNYCIPSLKNQTNQNFKWLVFFDDNTPVYYKQKIEEYTLSFKNFYPFFIDGMKHFLPTLIEKVGKTCTKIYIITSRLDNDDCLHKDYVEVVQSYFNNQDYGAVDLIDGYTMQIGTKVRLGKKRQLYNPFISLIEKKENCKTVMHKEHAHWKYEKDIIRVKNKRLWLMLVHDKNMKNTFTGYGKVGLDILDEFNVRILKIQELSKSYENYNSWRLQNFKNMLENYSKYYTKELKKIIGLYGRI